MSRYINTKELEEELIFSKSKGESSKKLILMIVKIIDGIMNSFAISDNRLRLKHRALNASIKLSLNNFDVDKNQNAFNYITQVIKSELYRSITNKIWIKMLLVL